MDCRNICWFRSACRLVPSPAWHRAYRPVPTQPRPPRLRPWPRLPALRPAACKRRPVAPKLLLPTRLHQPVASRLRAKRKHRPVVLPRLQAKHKHRPVAHLLPRAKRKRLPVVLRLPRVMSSPRQVVRSPRTGMLSLNDLKGRKVRSRQEASGGWFGDSFQENVWCRYGLCNKEARDTETCRDCRWEGVRP